MSEPVTKQRPTVDLDDFDRRLHEQVRPHDDDPLAELARLVGERPDPYGDVFAREAIARPPAYQGQGRHEPDLGQHLSPRLSGDFAAIEAGLRGAFSPEAPDTGVPTYAHDPYHAGQHQADAPHGYQQAQDYAQTSDYDEAQWAPHDRAVPPARNRRPVFIMAATIAVGVIGIGAAFALKGHGSGPGEVRTIMAAAGPTKIQPPADMSQDAASSDSSILGKTNQPAPTKLVNREEQPVDLSQTVEQNARMQADAASVPVPLSPVQQQDAINANPGAAISDQGFNITPKKVKSISVRPDGTILPNDQPPAAAMPASNPVKNADRGVPVARSSTPKSTSRVPTTPKPTQTADASDSAPQDLTPKSISTSKAVTTPKVVKKVKPPKPQRVATAETDNQDTTPPETQAVAPKADAGGGGWAVQLAAPTSEAEARSVSSKLGSKYADVLSGHALAFHKAASNGKTVYRVRAGGMSKDDASSLCDKLKADGGSCFIAKN